MNTPSVRSTTTRPTLLTRSGYFCTLAFFLAIAGPIAAKDSPSPAPVANIPKITGTPKPVQPLPPTISPKLDQSLGQVAIGGGGFFTGVYPSLAKPGEVYITSDMAGPWRRPSNDAPWQFAPVVGELNPTPGFGNSALALHPKDPLIIYADLGNGGQQGSPTGLWKTVDGGKTWSQLLQKYSDSNRDSNGGGSRQWGPGLVIDPNDTETVYWGTRRDGVWRTRDGGATWKQVLNLPDGCRNIAIAPDETLDGRSKRIHVGVFKKGIYTSLDGGETFTLDESFAKIAAPVPAIAWLRVARDGIVYASHNTHVARRDGTGWHDITPEPSEPGNFRGIAVDPADSSRVVAIRTPLNGPKGTLFRSTDGGKTWTIPSEIILDPPHAWDTGVSAMLNTASMDFDVTNPSGVFVTDTYSFWFTKDVWADKVVFEVQVKDAEITLTLDLATLPAVAGRTDIAPLFSGVSDIRGFRHADIFTVPGTGQTGSATIKAPGEWSPYVTSVDFCEADPDIVYAAKSDQKGNQAKLLRSTDNGRTWLETTNPLPGQEQAGSKIAVSATEPGRVVYFPGKSQSPFYTTDGGVTWKTATIAGTKEPLPFVYFKNSGYNFAHASASDRVDGNAFYAYVYRKGEPGVLWVSRDGGETWKATKSDLPSANPHDSNSPVTLYATPGIAGDVWLALGMGGLWHSTDFGANFTKIPDFPGSRPLLVSPGVADPRVPDAKSTIYVYGVGQDGLEKGLHRSLDSGKTWETLSRVGFQNFKSYMLMADRQTYGRVYFGTGGIGIWYAQTDQF